MASNKPDDAVRALVVDAASGQAIATAQQLNAVGFETHTAHRRDEAIKIYLELLPALVLVELVLPDGSGFDLIREIRSYDWSHSTTILIHAAIRGSLEVVEADARRAGANSVTPKPLELEALTEFFELSAPTSSGKTRPPTPRALEAVPSEPNPERLEGLTGNQVTVGVDMSQASRALEPSDSDKDTVHDDSSADVLEVVALSLGDPLGIDGSEDALDTQVEDLLPEPLPPPPTDEPRSIKLGAVSLEARVIREEDLDEAIVLDPREEDDEDTDTAPMPSVPDPHAYSVAGGAGVARKGSLASDSLFDILAAAVREAWYGRIRVESGRVWTELSIGDGFLWSVSCDETGPSPIDVGFRHGILPGGKLAELRSALGEWGERGVARVLERAGTSQDEIKRVLQLTATERVMAAFELHDGDYYCRANVPPTGDAFDAKTSLVHLIAIAVDRHYPVMRAVERYANREQDILRKTERFEVFTVANCPDDFARQAYKNLTDGQSLLDWIQRNPANPGALFLLLTKLEIIGGVTIGDGPLLPRFTFRRSTSAFGNPQTGSVTIPARPTGAQKGLDVEETVADAAEDRSDRNSGPPLAEAAPASCRTKPVAAEMKEQAPAEDSEPLPPLEGAGLSGSVRHLVKTSGEHEPVEAGSDEQPAWQLDVFRALDRWDFAAAQRALQEQLVDFPDDVEAASYEAWLGFARFLEQGSGDPGQPLTELEHVMEAAPESPAPYFLLGLAALSLGNIKQARTHIDRALEIAPDDLPINAANALVRAGYYSHPEADLSSSAIWKTVRASSGSLRPK